MIYKEHLIELWINGNKVELEDQDSLNMRFNNTLFDPTKISSTQSEYSFEFEVPATPHNNVIFDYANNLSKDNKFHSRYNAEVYCDGIVIFSGSITVNSYKDKKYKLNLVSVKVYSLDDIFGDAMMTDIRPMQRNENGSIKTGDDGEPLHEKWAIEFSGVTSINTRNGLLETDVVFPLVSYGAFQKNPYNSDTVGNDYTSKFDFDQYNNWYVEDFYPSHNMLATLKNCFETKNRIVGGDAFENPYLRDIYMSVNLADGQSPDYNVGNPVFGNVDLSTTFTASTEPGVVQDLTYPYFKITGYVDLSQGDPITHDDVYNLEAVQIYNLLGEGSVTLNQSPSYMYQPNEELIVIPADGFYKVELEVDVRLLTSSALTAAQYVKEWNDDIGALNLRYEEKDISFTPNIWATCPVEIQLVRNYDDNLELIKGKRNMMFRDGYPDHATEAGRQGASSNYTAYYTCFPHEKAGLSYWLFGLPTKGGDLLSGGDFYTRDASVGYMPKDNEIMCYDQVVSPTFICGFSTLGMNNGTIQAGQGAVMKNGYSWSKLSSEKNETFYNEIGYDKCNISQDWSGYVYESTNYNMNSYINAPVLYMVQDNQAGTMRGKICCMTKLKKGDVLQLFAVHRDYNTTAGTQVTYSTSINANLKIRAFSPRSYEMIKTTHDNRYEAPVEFDEKLNLANFFNKEKKMSDWVKNIIDAFNFDVIQDGNTVTINTRKKSSPKLVTAVDIDDRVNSADAEASKIDYPRSMAVKYKIDTDEWGFERSAVYSQGGDESILDNEDWYKYGDSGFTVINLNDDTWETSTSDKNLQFSYTWYDNFYQYQCNSSHEKTSQDPVTLRLPVISKYMYMMDGYDYTESMKHDGYGQPQRFWFRPRGGGGTLWTRTVPSEQVVIYTPVNMYTNFQDVYFNLSYKDTEPSLLTEFFNTRSYLASNYVSVDVYLTPDEYYRIKNGAYVHFDSDLYIPVEISAYDPTGYNETTLKMMKKII